MNSVFLGVLEMVRQRKLPRPFELPWGRGEITEEATILHDHWAPTIQLLEYEDGQVGVRFCNYSPQGRFQRQPAIWTEEDFASFGEELAHAPKLKGLFQRLAT